MLPCERSYWPHVQHPPRVNNRDENMNAQCVQYFRACEKNRQIQYLVQSVIEHQTIPCSHPKSKTHPTIDPVCAHETFQLVLKKTAFSSLWAAKIAHPQAPCTCFMYCLRACTQVRSVQWFPSRSL
jgi:hypothetical protein